MVWKEGEIMAGLKKVNVVKTTMSNTAVAAGCVCDGACWAASNPDRVKQTWFDASKKASVSKTVSWA